MSALATLARLLGIGDHQAEDALHSVRAARAVLCRRDLLAAGAALAAGSAFSFGRPQHAWPLHESSPIDDTRRALSVFADGSYVGAGRLESRGGPHPCGRMAA